MKQLLINMPVSNPAASKAFFEAIGLTLNEAMSDERATCFIIREGVSIALLPVAHFEETLMGNSVADAHMMNEMHVAMGAESREDVDALTDKAIDAGGKELHDPIEAGVVYGRSFADLDGHRWNIFFMSEER